MSSTKSGLLSRIGSLSYLPYIASPFEAIGHRWLSVRMTPEQTNVVVTYTHPMRIGPGSSPGSDDAYAPRMRPNEGQTRVWYFPSARLTR